MVGVLALDSRVLPFRVLPLSPCLMALLRDQRGKEGRRRLHMYVLSVTLLDEVGRLWRRASTGVEQIQCASCRWPWRSCTGFARK